ncbi:MAG: adenylate kinase family protein, partial [Chloroflexota bacterium]
MALHITAPTDVLVMRLGGRVICPVCGSIYNLASMPPKQDMICDLDGRALERRSDEEPETIVERLQVYERQTRPLIEYYRTHGSLVEIDGSQPIPEVEAAVDAAAGLRSVH